MTRITAQERGRLAQVAGRHLHDLLDLTHAMYARRGLAVMARTNPVTAGPPGHMKPIRKSEADYVGLLRSGEENRAVPVAFDAKSVHHASFAVEPRDAHQLAFLLDFAKAGGIAFYFCYDRKLGMGWLLGGLGNLMLLRQRPVTLRTLTRGRDRRILNHHPVVYDATVPQRAAAMAPLDYLPVALAAFGGM